MKPACSSENRFLQIITAAYVVVWIALAIAPVDRSDWLLENLLVFATGAVLVATWRRFPFSNFSYALIAVFLVVHAIGAHYTYAKVPVGFWLRDLLGLSRNHYDRLIHFAFGLLIVYPLREILTRSAGVRDTWAIGLSVAGIVGLSSFFEIVEGIIAQIVSPELGTAYLGTQGDIWDAQKDMAAATLGAILMTALTLGRRPRAPRHGS
jgi:putative membrane protein